MKKFALILLIFGISLTTKAQQFPAYNQFLYNAASLFPAYSGFSQNIESFVTLEQRFQGFPGAPKLADFYIGGNLAPSMGLSLDFLNESSGNFTQNLLRFSYAYFIKINDDFFVNVGLTPTLFTVYYNVAGAQNFGRSVDPVLNNSSATHGLTGDFGFSFAVHYQNLDFAMSAPQLIGLKAKLNGQNYSLSRCFATEISYNFNLSRFQVKPIVLALADQNLTINLKAGLQASLDKQLYTSIMYSNNGQLDVSFGGLVKNNIFISYTYGLGLAGMSRASASTHSLNIGFVLKYDNHPREPSVFIQTGKESSDVEQKIQDLEKKLRKEQLQRQRDNQRFNQRIDSLKNLLSKQQPAASATDTTKKTPGQDIVWVQKVISPTINFGLNSSILLPSSYPELNKYVQLLKQDPTLKMMIVVHTDNLGSPEFKLKLSEARAKAIADYILSKGVNPNQIIYLGKGGSEPIASNATLEGRRKNNRVEIRFNKKVLR